MKNVDRITILPRIGLYINSEGQLIEPTQGLEITGLQSGHLPDESFLHNGQWEDEDFTRLDGPSTLNH